MILHLHFRNVETKINVFGTNSFKTVCLRNGEKYKEKCMVTTVTHGGGSVLMWGCMSATGVGELHFIDGIMNSHVLLYTERKDATITPCPWSSYMHT